MTYTFNKEIKAMTAAQITQLMVNGLRKRHVAVNMKTFGSVRKIKGKTVCFGCAATNAACEASGKVFEPANIESVYDRATFINASPGFLILFETAINRLRRGELDGYSCIAVGIGVARISNPLNLDLPILANDYTEKQLKVYERLAQSQTGESR